jgi:uncharacterized protein (TIGR03437 family)
VATLYGAGLPDLAITGFTAPISALIGANPKSSVPGAQINVTVTVLNNGTADAPATTVGFYLSPAQNVAATDVNTGYPCAVPALSAGSSYTCTSLPIGIPGGLTPGTYYIAAIADPLNVIPELTKTNNVRLSDNGPISLKAVAAPTFAGSYAGNYNPSDGNSPLNTPLESPSAIKTDPLNSDIYVADTYNHRIRKISYPPGAAPIITTVLGNGVPSGAGDLAWLDSPQGLAIDAGHNVYVSDTNRHRVLKVTPAGSVSIVAGTGSPGLSADNVVATQAPLNLPTGLALSPLTGNLWIADQANNRILEIRSGKVFRAVGSNTQGFCGDGGSATDACLDLPAGLTFDAAGNLYIADAGNFRVRMVNSTISTVAGNGQLDFAGDGLATSTAIGEPTGLAIDAQSNLLITDSHNCIVWRINLLAPPPNYVSRFVGKGTCGYSGDGASAVVAMLGAPGDVTLDLPGSLGASQNLYVTDMANGVVRRLDETQGIINTVAGTGPPGASGQGVDAATASLNLPGALTTDSLGYVYVSDVGNGLVRKIAPVTNVITTVAGNGNFGNAGDSGPPLAASFVQLGGLAVDSKGVLYIADRAAHRVRKVSGGIIGTFVGTGVPGNNGPSGAGTSFPLNAPDSLAVDANDNLYIADTLNYRVLKVTPAGAVATFAGTGTQGTAGDGGPAVLAQLLTVQGLAFDPQGNLYISESSTTFNRVRKITLQNVISTVVDISGVRGFSGDGSLASLARVSSPVGLASDISGGVYVVDQANQRVRRLGVDSLMSTVAGSGYAGFALSGNPLNTALNSPAGVTVDSLGNVLVSDQRNHRILKLSGGTSCSVVLSANGINFSGDGAQLWSFNVITAATCQWTATPSASWIHIVSGSPGAGSGTVNCSLDPNSSPGVPRSGSIQIADQNYTITQGVAPPTPAISAIRDAFTFAPGISPGAWVTLFGTNLPSTAQSWSPPGTGPLPTSLGGVSVMIGGIPAPISYVGPTQINLLVPGMVGLGQVSVVVNYGVSASAPFSGISTRFLPAIASSADGLSPPHFHVIAVDTNTQLSVGNSSSPVRNGQTIDLYCIGLGPIVTGAPPTTNNFQNFYPLASDTSMSVVFGPPGAGGMTVTPIAAGLVSPGLYLVRVTVPLTFTLSGDQPILLDFGITQSAGNVYLTFL